MPCPHSLPDADLQLAKRPPFRPALREDGPVNVLGAVPGGSPDDDLFAGFVPFEN
jgi:hypothetical protein